MDRQELLMNAINEWGIEAQQLQLIEECSELITAILHYKRGKCTTADVVTEIADVMIMCWQMQIFFGCDDVDKEIEYKLRRLESRLGKSPLGTLSSEKKSHIVR